MRKKSHISLARYIVKSLSNDELTQHKKAFYIGNILPDCKPSFVTTRHEFFGTFDLVREAISRLTLESDPSFIFSSAYYRNLGEVTHYLADYFTFPHNITYAGNIREHCAYEEQLKISLKQYIKSGEVNKDDVQNFNTLDDLIDFIKKTHSEYLKFKRTIEEDCKYIVSLCHKVVAGILHLLLQNREQMVPVFA